RLGMAFMRKRSTYPKEQVPKSSIFPLWRVVATLFVLVCVMLSFTIVPSAGANPVPNVGKPSAAPSDDHLTQSYGKLPLSFEPNLGQMDSTVKFIAHGAGSDLFLTSNEIILSLTNSKQFRNTKSSTAP